jgi:hypothetical protein
MAEMVFVELGQRRAELGLMQPVDGVLISRGNRGAFPGVGHGMPMELWSALKEDHRNIAATLDEMKGRPQLREDLIGDLKDQLAAHFDAEEAIIYPALREVPGYAPLVAQAIEQHTAIRHLAEQLAGAPEEVWESHLAALHAVVDLYVEEEEDKIIDAGRHELPAHTVEHMKHDVVATRKAAFEARQDAHESSTGHPPGAR